MKTKTVTLLIAVATLFPACDKNAPATQELNHVGFTANLNDATRVSGTNWSNGDAIGIFMIGDETMENKQHTTSGDGNFTPVHGNEIYYPQDGSSVDFVAYYPYSDSVNGTSLNIEIPTVQTSENISQIDLLYATASEKSKYDAYYVTLPFEHALSKVVLNTTADPSMGISLAGMNVKIYGTNTVADFDLTSGTIGASSSPATITPHAVTDGVSYEAIILPVSYGGQDIFNIEFTVDGEVFTVAFEAMKFVAGTEYIYNVTITRTSVLVNTATINDWTTVYAGDVITY